MSNTEISNTPVSHYSVIDNAFEKIVVQLDTQDVNANTISTMMHQIFAMMSFALRMQGKTNNEIERILKNDVKVFVKDLQSAQTNKVKLGIEILGAAGMILGSGFAGSSIFGKSINAQGALGFTPNAWSGWKYCDGLGTTSSHIGDAVAKYVGGGIGSFDGAKQTGASNILEMAKQEMNKKQQDGNQADNLSQQMASLADRTEQNRNQTSKEMTR